MTSLLQILGDIGQPDLNRAQGVDVYGKYQGYFRPETATQRIDFAIQKLTEGITIVDARRDEIWAGVRQIGMRGAYHYQRSGVSWLAQANYFLEYAAKYDHHFFALDVEEIGNQLNDAFASDLYRIINHWKEQAPGKRIVLYSNKNLLQNFIYPRIERLFGVSGVSWLVDEVDIWYAQYYFLASVNKQPSLPSWMKTWRLWQITASAFRGPDFGVESKEVDVDVFNGTVNEMRAWLGLAPATEEPPTQPPPPVVVTPQPSDRPEITPEPRQWSAEVLPFLRMTIRTYPIVADDTATSDRVIGAETFSGRIWSGNDYLWMRIEKYDARPQLIGKWVAVRRSDGQERFIRLLAVPDSQLHSGYWVALHDWQMPPYQVREIRDWMEGTPEVFRVGELENPNHYFGVTMSENLQRFWFEICSRHVFKRASKDLTREEHRWLGNRWTALGGDRLAFMNHHGLDTCRNFITGENKDEPLPVLYTIICGGASLAGSVVANSKGVEMVALDYFDVTKPLPDPASIDIATDPRIFFACNITRAPVAGGYKVIRFPKFSEPEKDIYRDCPVPLMSAQPLYYPKSQMKWVQGAKPSPYFP